MKNKTRNLITLALVLTGWLLIAALTPAYGVDIASSPNDFNDDIPAIKVAIATACSGTDKIVRFVNGTPGYMLSEPIVNACPDVQLVGPEYGYATIAPQFGSGPAILIASPRKALDLLPSLVTGDGNAMSLAVGNYLYTSDSPTMQLHGLSQLTVEAFISCTDTDVTSPNVFLSSQGVLLNSRGVDSAFRVMVRYGNVLEANFTDTSGYHSFFSQPNAWTVGSHHVAFQYQSGSAYLFLDGQVVASYIGQTGFNKTAHRWNINPTLVQQKWEEVMIGGAMNTFPYGGLYFNSAELSAIDSPRISDIARYPIAGFTPPATKSVRDANTLLLCNFNYTTNNFVRCETNSNPYYAWLTLPLPDLTATPYGQIGHVGVRNIQVIGYFGASGVYGLGTVHSYFQNVSTNNVWHSLCLRDVYYSRLQDLSLTSRRIGLFITQGEAMTVDRVASGWGYFPFVLTGAAGGDFRNIFLTPTSETVASGLLKGSDVTITAINVDDEGQAGNGGLASLIIGDAINTTFVGGQILNYSTHPTLIVDGVGQGRVLLSNTAFFTSNTVLHLINVTSPRANLIRGGITNMSGTPLTNEPSAVNVSQ